MLKRPLFSLLAGLFFAVPVFATDSYFEDGRPDSSTPCTLADKCDNMEASTLDNANAVACGDTLNLERGSDWEGQEAAYILNSGTTACSSNRIKIRAHGTGTNPTLYGATVTTTGWSVDTAPNILIQSAAQSQTYLKTVVYNSTDSTPANYKAMFYWSGTTTTLPTDTFKRSSTTLRVNCGGCTAASSNIRIGNYSHTADSNGSRGLLSVGTRSGGSTYGHYIDITDINIIGPNGVGFSMSGTHVRDSGVLVIGAGSDGWLCYEDLSTSKENCDYYESYGSTVKYSAAGVHGAGGFGQGWTAYGSFGWWVYARSEQNAMAGYDWLNFGPSTAVTEAGCLWCYANQNGIAPTDPSFDGNYYIDGGSKIFIAFSRSHRSGIGSGTAGNARTGALAGSEHPSTDPTSQIYFIGNWFDTTFWVASGADNPTSSTANLTDFTYAYNTIVAYRSGGQSWCLQRNDWDTSVANSFKIFNNILYPENSAAINTSWATSTLDTIDSDGNQIYRQGGSDVTFRVDSVNLTLAQWRTASGEDANSAFGDPKFVDDVEECCGGPLDVTLDPTSPAIDRGVVGAYTVPSWLPTTIKNYLGTSGIRGSTVAAGTEDNYDTAPDAGYHKAYPDLTSTNMEPASLVASTSGTMSVSFTIPQYMGFIPYNGGIKFTLPAGYTINSGGTTAFTSSTISGTWNACSVSGQDVTCTRVGDGNSEFPGDYTGSLTFIGNGSAGATGVYKIYVLDSSGNVIARDINVASDTITAASGSAHFSCSGVTEIKGVRIS